MLLCDDLEQLFVCLFLLLLVLFYFVCFTILPFYSCCRPVKPELKNMNRKSINTVWIQIMRCPSVKDWTHYVFKCMCYICTGLCIIPVPWSSKSLLALALIKLSTEWEHIKNWSSLQTDGWSLWQGQRTGTQACCSCEMLRKLRPRCWWVLLIFFFYFNSYK